jgi:hypothetical protein
MIFLIFRYYVSIRLHLWTERIFTSRPFRLTLAKLRISSSEIFAPVLGKSDDLAYPCVSLEDVLGPKCVASVMTGVPMA